MRPLDVEHDDWHREPGDARDCGGSATAFEWIDEARTPHVEQTGILDHRGVPLVRYVMPVTQKLGFHLSGLTPHDPDEVYAITTEADLRMLATEAGRMDDSDFDDFEDFEDEV